MFEIGHRCARDTIHQLVIDNTAGYFPALQNRKIQWRGIDPGLGRTHAVPHRAMASDAKLLVDHVAALQAGLGGWIGIGQITPALGHDFGQPAGIGIRSGLIGLDGFLFPVTLPLHTFVCRFQSQTLNILGKCVNPLITQPSKGRHDRIGTRVARIHEMRNVPIVGMLTTFLRQVDAGARRPQLDGAIPDVIAGLRNAVGAMPPIKGPDRLAMAIHAAVLQVDFEPGLLHLRAIAIDLRRRIVCSRIGPHDHQQDDDGQDGEGSADHGYGGHFHSFAAPGLKNNVRTMLYSPRYAPARIKSPAEARMT